MPTKTITGRIIDATLATLLAIWAATVLAVCALLALPACAFEDGSGGPTPCFWDGSTRGDGIGASVIILWNDGPVLRLP